MKTTVGKVRKIIREVASPETDVETADGFKVGEHYFVPARFGHAGAARLCSRIYTRDSGPKYGVLTFVDLKGPGVTSSRRSDAWIDDGVRPATADEVKQQVGTDAAEQDYMRRSIDTSKEGT